MKNPLFSFISGLLALFLLSGNVVQGQGIPVQTTIGTVPSACVGDTILVPVTVAMGTGISVAAISLSVDFDTTKLLCLNTANNINPNIATGF